MKFMREPEVLAIVPWCRSQLANMVRAGEFPAPRQLGARSKAWLADDVERWVLSRPIVSWATPPDEVASNEKSVAVEK
jgi:prophage regulatory protein